MGTASRSLARSPGEHEQAVAALRRSYAAVPAGRPVAVVNSWDHLEIAVRDGSAAASLGAGVGDDVIVA